MAFLRSPVSFDAEPFEPWIKARQDFFEGGDTGRRPSKNEEPAKRFLAGITSPSVQPPAEQTEAVVTVGCPVMQAQNIKKCR
jgi:hypothetical protein